MGVAGGCCRSTPMMNETRGIEGITSLGAVGDETLRHKVVRQIGLQNGHKVRIRPSADPYQPPLL